MLDLADGWAVFAPGGRVLTPGGGLGLIGVLARSRCEVREGRERVLLVNVHGGRIVEVAAWPPPPEHAGPDLG